MSKSLQQRSLTADVYKTSYRDTVSVREQTKKNLNPAPRSHQRMKYIQSGDANRMHDIRDKNIALEC